MTLTIGTRLGPYEILEKCLEKDPRKRLRDISGVSLLLDEPASARTVPGRGSSGSLLTRWRLATIAIISLAGRDELAAAAAEAKGLQPSARSGGTRPSGAVWFSTRAGWRLGADCAALHRAGIPPGHLPADHQRTTRSMTVRMPVIASTCPIRKQ
jgi:hypothetical protein